MDFSTCMIGKMYWLRRRLFPNGRFRSSTVFSNWSTNLLLSKTQSISTNLSSTNTSPAKASTLTSTTQLFSHPQSSVSVSDLNVSWSLIMLKMRNKNVLSFYSKEDPFSSLTMRLGMSGGIRYQREKKIMERSEVWGIAWLLELLSKRKFKKYRNRRKVREKIFEFRCFDFDIVIFPQKISSQTKNQIIIWFFRAVRIRQLLFLLFQWKSIIILFSSIITSLFIWPHLD